MFLGIAGLAMARRVPKTVKPVKLPSDLRGVRFPGFRRAVFPRKRRCVSAARRKCEEVGRLRP